jgi:hypothetical protein
MARRGVIAMVGVGQGANDAVRQIESLEQTCSWWPGAPPLSACEGPGA